jgi:hypothetical protein
MTQYDLKYIWKFMSFYNAEYSSNMKRFSSLNQEIESFRLVSWGELLLANSKAVQELVEARIQQIDQSDGIQL